MQERGEKPSLRRAGVALQHRDYRLFYFALLAAAIGSQLQATANIIQIYDMTHSAVHLGLTGLARGIPTFAFSLMGGVIADRVDRRKLIMVTQAVNGLGALLLGGLTATGQIDVWHIYALMVLTGSLAALSSPARQAMVPNLVPRHHLLNAIALNSTVWQTANIVGPSIAGVLIATFGLPSAYLGTGFAQLITLSSLAVMRVGPIAGRTREPALRSIGVGLAFMRQRSLILALLAMDAAAMLFGTYRALTPIFAEALGVGHEGVGLLLAAPGVGSLLGAAGVMAFGDFRYKGLAVIGGILAYCASLVVFALSPWFPLSMAASVALGFCDSLQSTPRNGIIALLTPDEVRGRVSAFQYMLVNGMPSLGQTLSGGTSAIFGAPMALTIGAFACAAVVLVITAARPDLREERLGAVQAPRQEPARA